MRLARPDEVGSTQTLLTRVKDKFDLVPDWMIADIAYGSGPMLGWLVDRKIDLYIPVIDMAGRPDGTFTCKPLHNVMCNKGKSAPMAGCVQFSGFA